MTTKTNSKIQQLRDSLKKSFYERDEEIDGSLTALLAGEHTLLFGPPGTGKSALANTLCQSIDGSSFFQWLLTKFSTPEEVFGPVSLKGLENDQFSRVTTGKLPECNIAFLDEIFKANSSILNSLLTLVNERKFHNNGTPMDCPLLTVFGASNEMPESDNLEALFDRFLVRYWVSYVKDQGSLKSLLTDSSDPAPTVTITLDDVKEAQKEAANVTFPDAEIDNLLGIKHTLEQKGIKVSDRRWKRIVKALKAFAYLEGDSEVSQDHFEMLIHMLWREPKEINVVADEIRNITNPWLAKAVELFDSAKEICENLPSPTGDKIGFITAAADANAQLEKIEDKVKELAGKKQSASKKARIQKILDQVSDLYKENMRKTAIASGIKL